MQSLPLRLPVRSSVSASFSSVRFFLAAWFWFCLAYVYCFVNPNPKREGHSIGMWQDRRTQQPTLDLESCLATAFLTGANR